MSSAPAIAPPAASEYAPYYNTYISLVGGDNILESLERLGTTAAEFYSTLPEEQAGLRYAPGKWSIGETLGHVIDTERIMTYRALRFSRNDTANLPGFEQEGYIEFGPYAKCTLADLVAEFSCVRHASLYLFRNLDQSAWMRSGTADNKQITVRSLAYIVAGHELHHRKIVQERYLGAKA
jgi:uncharacterized damage-inducible protein DinB